VPVFYPLELTTLYASGDRQHFIDRNLVARRDFKCVKNGINLDNFLGLPLDRPAGQIRDDYLLGIITNYELYFSNFSLFYLSFIFLSFQTIVRIRLKTSEIFTSDFCAFVFGTAVSQSWSAISQEASSSPFFPSKVKMFPLSG
jgi:hypothetical protein